jgi:hypothetical protein
MNPAMKSKLVKITPPGAIVDAGSYTTASIDTKGYDYMRVVVWLGATDIAMTALKLQTSDTDGSYGDLTGAVFGTSTNIAGSTSTLPADDADTLAFVFLVNLVGKKRYFDLVAMAGDGSAGTYLFAFAELYRGEDQLLTAAGLGASQVLLVE